MHSHVLPCQPGPRPVSLGRRLARRAEAMAPFWRALRRPSRALADPGADLLNPDRAPEESYRDYMFRRAIWR